MKRFLISTLILLIVAGCAASPPPLPTTDPCLGLHTIGLPECRPPDDWVPATTDPSRPKHNPTPTALPTASSTARPERSVRILVDDFSPQPYQGDSVYFYNRLEGDRGALNSSTITWDSGEATATILDGNIWGGLWMSLNHPIREGLSINFAAVLPAQILPPYQAQITGMVISIADASPASVFRAELKANNNNLEWSHQTYLSGTAETITLELPALQDISQLVLVLDNATGGNYVVIDDISLTATTPVTDTATESFVWSYGMLLNNWSPSTGLVRDKAKDASGEFDAIQATGSLAAATVLAEQLGVVGHADAVAIVQKIGDALLNRLPRNHGLWPHWVKALPDGTYLILPDTEWSSVDTVIAAIGLLDAQQYLGLDTSATEQMIREIDWDSLVTQNGISHGYGYDDQLIPYAWDVFGGESWLVQLAYASATGKVAPINFPTAPTANGSGFIDELAWLYVIPPTEFDYWENDWASYRSTAAEKQLSYYSTETASSCFTTFGLFGLSAAEVPVPAQVKKNDIYQAFGVGGQFTNRNDGSTTLGLSVVAPHYAAMIASLHPEQATRMWDWLITNGYFSPLNNVESLAFAPDADCISTRAEWNQLKGSWNLALQALGWGRYLVERDGKMPAVWETTKTNPFLEDGYRLLAPNEMTGTTQPDTDPLGALKNGKVACENESDYKVTLPGTYSYEVKDLDGKTKVLPLKETKGQHSMNYASLLGWPPNDTSIPPWFTPTKTTQVERVTTHLGTFQALRIDEFLEYHVQTENHSDPTGKVNKSEWYVCGLGLVRGIMHHSGSYAIRSFEHESTVELISVDLLP